MASTTFIDQSTVIAASWLNDVNSLVYTVFNVLAAIPSAGKVLRSNGTNIVPSTFTIPDTFTTGDLLQATGANTLTALAAVATGNALISGGVGTASSWGKIGLTTHVSGTLGVGNGGTGLAATGTDGQTMAASSGALVYIDNPSRANLLINPNWQIDQINEGALYTVNTTGVNGPDGWSGDSVGGGVFKLRTLADPDNAALKCLEITCTTADAAPAATSRYEVWTAVEGYDAAALLLGTASAVPFIVQFKFKTNVTGVYGVYFSNSAGNRFYAGTITVPNTSENSYSVSLTGDLTGTWLYTNGIGLRMGLVLAAGSNFQGTAGAWGTSTVKTTASQANFMSAITNIAYLKRIQLIPGSLVQAYKPADIQRELEKTQRYYEKTYDQGTAVGSLVGMGDISYVATISAGNFTVVTSRWGFKVSKRAAPTITGYSPATGTAAKFRDNTGAIDINATFLNIGNEGVDLQFNIAGTITPSASAHATSNARLS